MRLMAIGIHPDDVEIGCGGTVAVAAAAGDDVTLVDLTRGEAATNGTAETRAEEAREAATILGCARRVNAMLPDTGVRSEDAEQLRTVVRIVRGYRPHIVLVPNADDPHPDHALGSQLVMHALFLSNVNGYVTDHDGRGQERWRVPRTLLYSGRREVRPDVVVDITATFETKLRAIRAHASQVGGGPGTLSTPLTDPGFLKAMAARATLAGRRVGVEYGEPFELVTPVLLRDLGPLAPSGS